MNRPRQVVCEVICEGTPFEMGLAQGEALRENIHDALQVISELEAFRLLAPWYLPFRLFRRIAESRVENFLNRAFAQTAVSAADRLRGIAEGARVPIRKLALCCLLEAVLSDLSPVVSNGPNGLQAGCSAVAITGAGSADGHAMVAHNFDYLPLIQKFYFVRRSLPAGKLRSLEFTVSPLAGTVDGVNEAGLAITCNYAYVTDKSHPAPTITMLISEALASRHSVNEAVDFFSQQSRVGGGLLMLADAEGTIASLEISNSRVERRDPQPETSFLFHTNRLECATMLPVELSEAAHHGRKSPRALRGRRVHQSADARRKSIEHRIAQRTFHTIDSLHAIMSDHGAGPSADSVCMHGDYWHTTACTQLLPAERKLRASFSTACTAEFQDFAV